MNQAHSWLNWPLMILLICTGCASHHRSAAPDKVVPFTTTEQNGVGRMALRMKPPAGAPALALYPGSRISGRWPQVGGGALSGAAAGTADILDGLSDSDAPALAWALLLPLAMATGAIVGALAATMDDRPGAAPPIAVPTPAAESGSDSDVLNREFVAALTALNIESVDHTLSDQEISAAGFASVIDVVLYKPVVAGKPRSAHFALLHKVQAQSLTGAFETRTWYREQVSEARPVADWLDDDSRAIQAQLLALQVNLARDFNTLLSERGPS